MKEAEQRWIGKVVPREVEEPIEDHVAATFSEALAASRGLLAPLFNAVPEIIVVIEVEEGPEYRFLTANRAFLEFTGLDTEKVRGRLIQEVFPSAVLEFIRERCNQASTEKKPLRYEQTLERDDKQVIFDATVSPIVDGEGKCSHLLWVARDISPMANAGEELRKKSAVLRLLHSASAASNRASSIEEAARMTLYEICTHTGWPVGHLYTVQDDKGTLFATPVWHLEDPKTLAPLRRATEIDQLDLDKGLATLVQLSGKPRFLRDASANPNFRRSEIAASLGLKGVYAFPISVGRKVVAVLEFFSRNHADPDTSLLEVMDLIGDQLARVWERAATRAELERTLSKIRTLSLTDELTGLNNRRGFIALAAFQVKFAKRNGKKLVLLFVDLDNMKQINDEFGHLKGDLALTDLTGLLNETFRDSDILARVGGDEFTVLLAANETDAGNSIARLDDALDRYNESAVRPFKLQISVGVAVFDPQKPATIEELIDRADAAMYKVKSEKRELFGSEPRT